MPVLRISQGTMKVVTKTEFAELLDTTKPVLNFDKRIPDPAVKYDFDLDVFQKLVRTFNNVEADRSGHLEYYCIVCPHF